MYQLGPGPRQAEFDTFKTNTNQSLVNLADGLAIVADGNTHAAIASGQYVYVRNHGNLAEGLYKANSAISANATLSSSNLTADSNGGLNSLNDQIENMLPFDNNFGIINKSKIRQVCGSFSITGSGADVYVVPLSTITGGRITDNSYLIAVSLVTYDMSYIATGTRLSATAGNMVVKFDIDIPNNTVVALRYLITYYTI